jgi:tetratricopeptide (TPR) repeat protein
MAMPVKNPSKQIDQLFEQEQWSAARRLIEANLRKLPAGDWLRHWWLTRLSTTYYEEQKYGQALEFARQAAAIAPDCPLVLWDEAGALDMLSQLEGAIRIYQRLLRRGERTIARDECGEGVRWARALVTDCHYRLGLCYERIHNYGAAVRHFRRFRDRRDQGSGSIYDDAEAARHLAHASECARTDRAIMHVEMGSLQTNGEPHREGFGQPAADWTLSTLHAAPTKTVSIYA